MAPNAIAGTEKLPIKGHRNPGPLDPSIVPNAADTRMKPWARPLMKVLCPSLATEFGYKPATPMPIATMATHGITVPTPGSIIARGATRPSAVEATKMAAGPTLPTKRPQRNLVHVKAIKNDVFTMAVTPSLSPNCLVAYLWSQTCRAPSPVPAQTKDKQHWITSNHKTFGASLGVSTSAAFNRLLDFAAKRGLTAAGIATAAAAIVKSRASITQ
mmetsp:Transcript_31273/g.51048  ORF Transcript_31273/g.51048 Transcript_31273/m.51048 type:complete len:215 (+) Transcript_31273:145-789(+)